MSYFPACVDVLFFVVVALVCYSQSIIMSLAHVFIHGGVRQRRISLRNFRSPFTFPFSSHVDDMSICCNNIVLDRRAVLPFCAVSDLWLLVEEELVERAFMAWQLLCSAVGRSRLSRVARIVLRLATGPIGKNHFDRPDKSNLATTDRPFATGIHQPRTNPEKAPLD